MGEPRRCGLTTVHYSTCQEIPFPGHDRCDAHLSAVDASPFDRLCADRLADEVAVLVRRGALDSRSPAADALLDYREPPSSSRADRLAEACRLLEEARAQLLQTLDRIDPHWDTMRSRVQEMSDRMRAFLWPTGA